MSEFLVKQGGKQDYNYKEYVIDSYSDIELINKNICCPGSIVYVISNGDIYMLNNKKEWIKQ